MLFIKHLGIVDIIVIGVQHFWCRIIRSNICRAKGCLNVVNLTIFIFLPSGYRPGLFKFCPTGKCIFDYFSFLARRAKLHCRSPTNDKLTVLRRALSLLHLPQILSPRKIIPMLSAIPINGGVGFLAAAGVAYGVKKYRDLKK